MIYPLLTLTQPSVVLATVSWRTTGLLEFILRVLTKLQQAHLTWNTVESRENHTVVEWV